MCVCVCVCVCVWNGHGTYQNVEEALAAARVAKQAEKAKNQCP